VGAAGLFWCVGCDDPLRSTGTGGAVGVGTGGGVGTETGGGMGTGTGGNAGTGTGGNAGTGTGGNAGTGTGGGVGTGGNAGMGTGGNRVIGTCPVGSGSGFGVASHPSEGANHTVQCDPVSYATMPPSSGTHYPTWPAYKTYAQPVPWGFLVHGLEHGAIAVVYNCPAGCAAEIAAAQAWIDGLPPEAGCGDARPRVILAPDPTLDVRWAATAWTWTLRACSFDQGMFQQFFDAHYNAGLEFVCSSGADYSLSGWCP
jgi:Protein of unknown function (DUF3105)